MPVQSMQAVHKAFKGAAAVIMQHSLGCRVIANIGRYSSHAAHGKVGCGNGKEWRSQDSQAKEIACVYRVLTVFRILAGLGILKLQAIQEVAKSAGQRNVDGISQLPHTYQD